MVVSPAPTHKHHKETHSFRNVHCKMDSGINRERRNVSKRPLAKGPLCSGSAEAPGIICPPPTKRPAGPSPTVNVDSKLRKQIIVKTVGTTFTATYTCQWACVAKFAPTSFRVNPTSWAGVLSVVFQRLKPLHRQMIKMFKRIEGEGWLDKRDLLWHQNLRHVTVTDEPTADDNKALMRPQLLETRSWA